MLGHVPWRRERALLRRIALLRGSRPLGGPEELTVLDTLRFQRLLYQVPEPEFRRNLGELTELLELRELVGRQVRWRRRCGAAPCAATPAPPGEQFTTLYP